MVFPTALATGIIPDTTPVYPVFDWYVVDGWMVNVKRLAVAVLANATRKTLLESFSMMNPWRVGLLTINN